MRMMLFGVDDPSSRPRLPPRAMGDAIEPGRLLYGEDIPLAPVPLPVSSFGRVG